MLFRSSTIVPRTSSANWGFSDLLKLKDKNRNTGVAGSLSLGLFSSFCSELSVNGSSFLHSENVKIIKSRYNQIFFRLILFIILIGENINIQKVNRIQIQRNDSLIRDYE